VGLFGKKMVTCPMCGDGLPAKENKLAHYGSHAVRSPDGECGWQCPCGESDGYWKDEIGAAAGMADHFSKRHGISMSVSLGQ